MSGRTGSRRLAQLRRGAGIMNIRVGVAVGATRWRPRITVRRAVVLLLAVSLAVPPALTAAPQCSGSTSFYFNGFQTFDLPSYGARGTSHRTWATRVGEQMTASLAPGRCWRQSFQTRTADMRNL